MVSGMDAARSRDQQLTHRCLLWSVPLVLVLHAGVFSVIGRTGQQVQEWSSEPPIELLIVESPPEEQPTPEEIPEGMPAATEVPVAAVDTSTEWVKDAPPVPTNSATAPTAKQQFPAQQLVMQQQPTTTAPQTTPAKTEPTNPKTAVAPAPEQSAISDSASTQAPSNAPNNAPSNDPSPQTASPSATPTQAFGDRIRALLRSPSTPSAPSAAPAATPSAPAPPSSAPPSRTGGRVACVSCDKPPYPTSARDRGVQGSARVSVDVDSSGNVINVRLLSSSGDADLDQAAIAQARRWRFTPSDAGKSGVSARVNFQLDQPSAPPPRNPEPKLPLPSPPAEAVAPLPTAKPSAEQALPPASPKPPAAATPPPPPAVSNPPAEAVAPPPPVEPIAPPPPPEPLTPPPAEPPAP